MVNVQSYTTQVYENVRRSAFGPNEDKMSEHFKTLNREELCDVCS
jgi:hypothetical protein